MVAWSLLFALLLFVELFVSLVSLSSARRDVDDAVDVGRSVTLCAVCRRMWRVVACRRPGVLLRVLHPMFVCVPVRVCVFGR